VPKTERHLIQIRLSDSDRRRIKSLAAKQGLTLQEAVVEAFNAWAEKTRTHAQRAPRSPQAPSSPPPDWLKRALRLDWTKCSEVELVSDGENQMWLFRESDAPLNIVLRALAEGYSVTEVAETFELEPPQLANVIQFASAKSESNALNL
jgi:hypothetical protein